MSNNKRHFFADPIYKSIVVSQEEKEIIDSSVFQRLRKIKQLGNVHLLFPGAVHTRFLHSMGVMHVSSLLFDSVFNEKKHEKREDGKFQFSLDYLRKSIRRAALLHDIGHGPFSHHFESCLRIKDKKSQKLVRLIYKDWKFDYKIPASWFDNTDHETILKEKLSHEHFSYALIYFLGEKYNFDAQGTCSLLCPKIQSSQELDDHLKIVADGFCSNGNYRASLRKCLSSLLSGEIDADRLDYLVRDSYYCGTSISAIDLPHLLSSIEMAFSDENFYIQVNQSAISVIENILISRKQMFNQVYYHRLNGTFDMMLAEVIDYLIDTNKIVVPQTVENFIQMTDDFVERKVADLIVNNDISKNIDSSEVRADLCAKFFTSRTPLIRLSSDEVEVGEKEDYSGKITAKKNELEKIWERYNAIVWIMKLKAFYGKGRYEPFSEDFIKVKPKNSDSSPGSLRELSDVIRSNLWHKLKVRIVIFKGFIESAEERHLGSKLSKEHETKRKAHL